MIISYTGPQIPHIQAFTADKGRALVQGPFKLLILDVIMPKLNGKNVLDIIRKAHPAMKAMFMSGYSADMLSIEGICREKTAFLLKPVDPVVFLNKARETLEE